MVAVRCGKLDKMTDAKFQLLLDKLSVAHRNYRAYLDAAEEEIKRRYGVYPSEIDSDQWIDSYHYGCGHMTVEQLDDSMKLHAK